MIPTSHQFRKNAQIATEDANLSRALDGLATGFVARRAQAISKCPEFEQLRVRGRDIRHSTFQNLAQHLTDFERQAQRAGSIVHWAETGSEACDLVSKICRTAEARLIAKGKSMVTEEIGLNDHLSDQGFEIVETDLGEYLLQVRGETPSHIIAPAIHLTEKNARDTFLDVHSTLDPDRPLDTPEKIVAEARTILRQNFLNADVGITGANFLVAETGSAIVVTNEGNGDLTATLPKIHIVITSIDKVVPSLSDASVLLQLLARSATGQSMTAYTSLFTGPKGDDDPDGPDACHIILVDNGRSELLASEAAEVLNCIRCGACLNHCPIYTSIGGHAYGWTYPGPIGAALNPGLLGISQVRDLPHASTLCGRCEEVCPVKIPLPKIFRQWRRQDFATRRRSLYNAALSAWAWLAQSPRIYSRWASIMAWVLSFKNSKILLFPFSKSWSRYRELPISEGRTFQSQWRRHMTNKDGQR